jgi:hypothetical protein
MAMHKPKKQRRFQDGGDVEEDRMKQRGLDISNRAREEGTEKTSFFQRLREGNIDDPNSAAYKKYGAGRARLDDQIEAGKSKLAEEVREMVSAKNSTLSNDGDVDERDRRMEAAANAPSRMPTRPGQSSSGRKPSAAPKVDAPASQEAKTAAEYSDATDAMRNRSRMAANSANKKSSTTDALRAKSRREAAFEGAKRMANTPEAQATRKAMEKGQALERVSPEEYIGPALGLKTLSKLAKKLATPKIKEYNPKMLPAPKAAPKVETKSLPAPQKKLSYDKAGAKAKQREGRAEKNRSEMLEENAKRYGLDPKSPGYDSTVKAVREKMGGKDFSFKKGGRVTASSASKRADGIAQRGKTRGKVY